MNAVHIRMIFMNRVSNIHSSSSGRRGISRFMQNAIRGRFSWIATLVFTLFLLPDVSRATEPPKLKAVLSDLVNNRNKFDETPADTPLATLIGSTDADGKVRLEIKLENQETSATYKWTLKKGTDENAPNIANGELKENTTDTNKNFKEKKEDLILEPGLHVLRVARDGEPATGSPEQRPSARRIDFLNVKIEEVIEPTEVAECTGYDKDENTLMVPMEGSNKIKVKLSGAPQSMLQEMKFVPSTTGKLTIDPEIPTMAVQELTISGTSSTQSIKLQLEFEGTKFDLFEVDVLKKRTEDLYVRAIVDTESNLPVSTPTEQQIVDFLNKTFARQANVFFTEIKILTVNIDYDLNNNGQFDWGAFSLEKVALLEKAKTTVAIDFYIFKNIAPSGTTAGNAWNISDFNGAGHSAIIARETPTKCTPLLVMAHEIGHNLGRAGHWDDVEYASYLMANGGISSCGYKIGKMDWRLMNP